MKKKRTLITLASMIILLSVVTLAYYTGGLSNDNAQTAELSTGTMELTFADGDNGIAAAITFGDTITKKFALTNTGTLDASASISWFNLINTYLDGSLIYTLEYSESLDGEYEPIVSNLMVPTSEEPITTPLVTQLTVPAKKTEDGTYVDNTYYYNLNITLVNSPIIDQTADINASFHTQFTLADASNLSASEQTLANLGLVVSNGTPDFSEPAGTTYKDNGFSSEEKIYNVSSSYVNSIIYYSNTYTFDESTGLYTLGTLKSEIYKKISDLNNEENVYISGYNSTAWRYTSSIYTTNIPAIYKIKNGSYDSNTNTGSFTYLEPNDNTLPDYSTTGIYAMEDDYGTSYYFRGAPENNYVKFGKYMENKDMYWRIVRINGDGSLRIIYDGTKAYKNGAERDTYCNDLWYDACDTFDAEGNCVGAYKCQGIELLDGTIDEAVLDGNIGYMYGLDPGNPYKCMVDDEEIHGKDIYERCEENYNGTLVKNEVDIDRCLMLDENDNVINNISTYSDETACINAGGKWTATAYDSAHANIKNSDVKTVIDNWYKTNIYDKSLNFAVSDTLFCNDRSISNGYGIGYFNTDYKTGERLNMYNNNIPTPQLICTQKNDRFTVDDVMLGNGDLTYSIGLITGDELVLAGGSNRKNPVFYLNKRQGFFSISPVFNDWDGPVISGLYDDGSVGSQYIYFSPVVPVLNLTLEYVSQMIGDGTIGNEFRVE